MILHSFHAIQPARKLTRGLDGGHSVAIILPDNFNVREVYQYIASARDISTALQMQLLDVLHADKTTSGGNYLSSREAGLMEDPTDYDPAPGGGKGSGAVLRSSPSPTADMKKGVERGPMLFSAPTQRWVDYAVTKITLDSNYERTEADKAAGRAFLRSIRSEEGFRKSLDGSPVKIVEERDTLELSGQPIGAAILSELSGKGLILFDAEDSAVSGGVTVPALTGHVFINSSPSVLAIAPTPGDAPAMPSFFAEIKSVMEEAEQPPNG